MTTTWQPTIRIDGKEVILTVELVDQLARGELCSPEHRHKLNQQQWEMYRVAQQLGYLVISNRRTHLNLQNIWFSWCEAMYHPHILLYKTSKDYWALEMDNIAFTQGRNSPFSDETRQQVRTVLEPFSTEKLISVGPGYTHIQRIDGEDQARDMAVRLLVVAKQCLTILAMTPA